MDGGIGIDFLRSLQQVVFRHLIFSQAEVSPAEGIEIGAVAGIEIHRPLDVSQRFFELHILVGQHIAQIIQRGSMIGIAGDYLLELFFRFGVALLALKSGAAEEPYIFLVFRLAG